MKKNMYIVYKTTNTINGKIYVGVHYSDSPSFDGYLGSGLHLKRAVRFYGVSNFERVTLFSFDNKEDAYEMERRIVNRDFVKRYDNYNIRIGGKGAPSGEDHHMYGKTHTPEAKKKISDMEHPKGMLGKVHTEVTKQRISNTQKGRVVSDYTKNLLRDINLGKVMSEESRKKMSAAKKGKYTGENSSRYGKSLSEETKKKISKANKGRKMDESFKEACSLRSKGNNNPNSKYLWMTPEGNFESAYEAGKHFGLDRKTIEQRCKKGYEGKKNRSGILWSDLGWNYEAAS